MFTLFFANNFKIKTIKYILKCKFLTTICTPAQNKEKNERTRQEQLSVSLADLCFLKTLQVQNSVFITNRQSSAYKVL